MSRLAILGALLLFNNAALAAGHQSLPVKLAATTVKSGSFKPAPAKSATTEDNAPVFAEAATLYKDGKFEQAVSLINGIKQSQGNSFRTHSYLAVLLFKTKPLIYPLAEARAAVKLNSKNAVANCNLGILLQRNGERSAAVEKYRAAIALDGTDWRPHLGIAQCLSIDGADGRVIAERELKLAAQTKGSDESQKWTALGAAYLVMEMTADAELCYSRALQIDSSYLVKRGRFKAALAANNAKVIAELLPACLTDMLDDKSVALALALPSAKLTEPQLAQLEAIAERNFMGADKFFYQLGRNFESGGHLDLAEKAYLQAISYSGADSAQVLALVGNRASAGHIEEARQLVNQYSGTGSSNGKSGKAKHGHKDVYAQSLTYAGQLLDNQEPSSLHLLKLVMSNIKCGCRIPVIEFQLRALPGVIFAQLQDAKDPPATIIYDAKVTTSKAISEIKREQDKVEVISDNPVKSLPELVKVIQTASDLPNKHIFTLWSFEPPPMELPK